MTKPYFTKENVPDVDIHVEGRNNELLESCLLLFTDIELIQTAIWITLAPVEELEFAD